MVDQLEYCTLGHIQYFLIVRCILSGEGNLANFLYKLLDSSLFHDFQLPAADFHLCLAHQGSCKNYLRSCCGDVDESARSGQSLAHTAYVVVSVAVNFTDTQACHIQAAAADQVKHLMRRQDCFRVVCASEARQSGRNTANHTTLGTHGHILNQAFLCYDLCNICRHADAKVNKVTLSQLHSTASADNLSFIKRNRLNAV